jgi:hypothetical protein
MRVTRYVSIRFWSRSIRASTQDIAAILCQMGLGGNLPDSEADKEADRYRLWYAYENKPNAEVRSRSGTHEGGAWLEVCLDDDPDRLGASTSAHDGGYRGAPIAGGEATASRNQRSGISCRSLRLVAASRRSVSRLTCGDDRSWALQAGATQFNPRPLESPGRLRGRGAVVTRASDGRPTGRGRVGDLYRCLAAFLRAGRGGGSVRRACLRRTVRRGGGQSGFPDSQAEPSSVRMD